MRPRTLDIKKEVPHSLVADTVPFVSFFGVPILTWPPESTLGLTGSFSRVLEKEGGEKAKTMVKAIDGKSHASPIMVPNFDKLLPHVQN